jgi:hypothetical protein
VEHYWYLGVLATRPERRKEGLATALLSPTIDEAAFMKKRLRAGSRDHPAGRAQIRGGYVGIQKGWMPSELGTGKNKNKYTRMVIGLAPALP